MLLVVAENALDLLLVQMMRQLEFAHVDLQRLPLLSPRFQFHLQQLLARLELLIEPKRLGLGKYPMESEWMEGGL
ncbi:hypothetical protein, partial [Klebsiella pneumoniae]|uniref:hypothetical protein n=1 Tax=Klebsiella pneumoniae TaxID=573 RepID=UPI0038529AC9